MRQRSTIHQLMAVAKPIRPRIEILTRDSTFVLALSDFVVLSSLSSLFLFCSHLFIPSFLFSRNIKTQEKKKKETDWSRKETGEGKIMEKERDWKRRRTQTKKEDHLSHAETIIVLAQK
jgi:hypothetical protein